MPDFTAYTSCFKPILQKKVPAGPTKTISSNSVLDTPSLLNHILLTIRYRFIPLSIFSYASSSTWKPFSIFI